jgi:hypothetical protein
MNVWTAVVTSFKISVAPNNAPSKHKPYLSKTWRRQNTWLIPHKAPAFNYSIREVIINPPNLNNSYYFSFLCGVIWILERYYIIKRFQRDNEYTPVVSENTRLIYDVLHFTEEQDIPGILLLIDFEKAFDSISWVFIESVLDFFNFVFSIKLWVTTFYTNITSALYSI